MATSATIGNLQITALVDLTPPPRDVSAIYPDVPAGDWGPYQDFALENGMWQTQFCSFLIRPVDGEGPIVLVDTAMGPGPHDPGDVPGKLLEELGFKGYTIGGAKFSELHANFIVNFNNASAKDIITLINKAKEKASLERGIKLETEVKIIGENAKQK